MQNAKQQTSFRYAYWYSGWVETWEMALDNVAAFHGFCAVWVPGQLRLLRTKRAAETAAVDIHPLNVLIAALMYVLGWPVMSALLLLLAAVKVLPMLLRAFVNHVLAAAVWSPIPCSRGFKWWFSPAYWLIFPLLPVAAALLFPAMLVFASYVAAGAAVDAITSRGALSPGLGRMRDALVHVDTETTKYIMRQDVPFLVMPSATPVSLPWCVYASVLVRSGACPRISAVRVRTSLR